MIDAPRPDPTAPRTIRPGTVRRSRRLRRSRLVAAGASATAAVLLAGGIAIANPATSGSSTARDGGTTTHAAHVDADDADDPWRTGTAASSSGGDTGAATVPQTSSGAS
jgi:hypothetical protein